MDWEQRKEEINIILSDALVDHGINCESGYFLNRIFSFIVSVWEKIIKQEKEMIYEFAEKCYSHLEGYENNEYLKSVLNDILEQYDIDKAL